MSKIGLFSKVIAKSATNHNHYGAMIVCEIRTPEEAEFYGSFEFMCRSLVTGEVIDFDENELLEVEE